MRFVRKHFDDTVTIEVVLRVVFCLASHDDTWGVYCMRVNTLHYTKGDDYVLTSAL